ncbi:hypothetical protein J6590_028687 [Homalodisca vitripennis]|nr:hypothetical protein J6590_028687 [Homalodisca vitripennis]
MEALRHYNKAGTSCAFVTARFVYGFCLHPVSSVYSAELSAIEKALKIPRTGKHTENELRELKRTGVPWESSNPGRN